MSKDRLPGDQIKVLLTAWMLRWFWKKFLINNEPVRYHTSFSVLWLLKCCQIFFVVFWFSIFVWGSLDVALTATRSDKIPLSYINIRYFPCLIQANSDLVSCVTRLCVAVTFSSTLKRNVVIFEGTLESRLETTKVSRD